jgi:hypothetical protein
MFYIQKSTDGRVWQNVVTNIQDESAAEAALAIYQKTPSGLQWRIRDVNPDRRSTRTETAPLPIGKQIANMWSRGCGSEPPGWHKDDMDLQRIDAHLAGLQA